MLTNHSVDILLVDDREDGLIALEALLVDNKDYRLVKAQSGREAIALLDQYNFAMVLLDVQMPELDGFQTAEIIRAKTKFETIPIIFVTAINKDDNYVYKGYEAGAVDYIFKPVDPVILRSKVSVFADLHRKNMQIREQAAQLEERGKLEHRAKMQSQEIENLRRYHNLADAIPHIVLRISPDGEMEYQNELWSNYTGLSKEESLHLGWQQAIHSKDMSGLLASWNYPLFEDRRNEIECRIRAANGTYRWYWIKAEPELDGHGKILSWLCTCTDIEDRKEIEEKLREAQKNAEAANLAKTHFLANMSHEIRTPLNAIMGFTELLLDPSIPMDQKMKSVSIVRRNGHQLLKIVDQILDISKVEAGGLVIERLDTRLPELLAEIKALMLIQAAKKGITLDFVAGTPIPSRVLTDPTRLRQILINIVGNAIKFTEKGSVKVLTRFLPDIQGNAYVRFEIIDTGVGVDLKAGEKIFQPFSQGDTSTTRLYGGTGLGLALSRRLARAMGGDLRLEQSELGKGSTFVVEVEVESVGGASWDLLQDDYQASKESLMSGNYASTLQGKRILLVEDAEDNQLLITHFLAQTGAIVELASNGREGIDKALGSDFDVVLMDIQMPMMDGYQATTHLRKVGYNKPIIALTAHALVEEREKSLRTGCDGHLTKPISRQRLVESLMRVVHPT